MRARVISSPGSFWLLTADKERERVKTSSVGRNCWPLFGLWHIVEVRWQSWITSAHLLSFGALACADLFVVVVFLVFFFLTNKKKIGNKNSPSLLLKTNPAIHRGRRLWMKDETFLAENGISVVYTFDFSILPLLNVVSSPLFFYRTTSKKFGHPLNIFCICWPKILRNRRFFDRKCSQCKEIIFL